MTHEHIKVTRWLDGEDRVVTVNDKVLSEAEIVDLLVEYMEENNTLREENEELREALKDCTKKAKEEIRKEKEEMAIRWANIGR